MLDWRCILAIVKFLLWRVSWVAITGEFFEEWVIFSMLNTEKDFMKIEHMMTLLRTFTSHSESWALFLSYFTYLFHHVVLSLEGFLATSFPNIVKWWTWVSTFCMHVSSLYPFLISLPCLFHFLLSGALISQCI